MYFYFRFLEISNTRTTYDKYSLEHMHFQKYKPLKKSKLSTFSLQSEAFDVL